ncbi:hypothetical protein [Pectinatus haikarae]|uniref:Type II secretion system protein GspC N-terminal domain-containing protein n=1 Tax=Pectinatus haikarae TaxID=349096 RepID=A0ABT9Y8U3_9FIRM|nr:hypothetical protein [Pectinatus haikarae]MDQ0204259.1 hypothetical protein [Pectinatus haikarae]
MKMLFKTHLPLYKKRKIILFSFPAAIFAVYLFLEMDTRELPTQPFQSSYDANAAEKLPLYNYPLHRTEPLRDPFSAVHSEKHTISKASKELDSAIVPKEEITISSSPAVASPPPLPLLAGTFLDQDKYSAIIILDNKYSTVTAGSHFSNYEVVSIDRNSIHIKNINGEIFICRLKGF